MAFAQPAHCLLFECSIHAPPPTLCTTLCTSSCFTTCCSTLFWPFLLSAQGGLPCQAPATMRSISESGNPMEVMKLPKGSTWRPLGARVLLMSWTTLWRVLMSSWLGVRP